MPATDDNSTRDPVLTRYRTRERVQGAVANDPILERCLDIIEGFMLADLADESVRAVVRKIGPLKRDWHTQRHIKASNRFFEALRAAAMRRGIRARANNLYHDSRYIALCRAESEALSHLNRKDIRPEDRISLAAETHRMMTELAGTLFVMPEIFPMAYLGLLKPKPKCTDTPGQRRDHRKVASGRICVGELDRRRREVAAALLWNEPVPILIDKRNEDAVPWHMEPEDPNDPCQRDRRHGFLWGRRILVSLLVDEVLAGSIARDNLWAVIHDFAQKVDSGRLESSKGWRTQKESFLRSEIARLAGIVRRGGGRATWARTLGEAFDKVLRHIDDYYSTKAGKTRGKRDRGGIRTMIQSVNFLEDTFEGRNSGIRRRAGNADVGDIPDQSVSRSPYGSDVSEEDTMIEITGWLKKNLPHYGLAPKQADKIVKDMLLHRLNDGRMAEGRRPAQAKSIS